MVWGSASNSGAARHEHAAPRGSISAQACWTASNCACSSGVIGNGAAGIGMQSSHQLAKRIANLLTGVGGNAQHGIRRRRNSDGSGLCIHHVAPAMSGTWSIRRMILQR
jgi:hypothetical protein